jgi:long-subunit fatty acid transport protein
LKVSLPATLRLGISYELQYRLMVSADYERQNWTEYVGVSGTNENMRNSQSYHIGFEYWPKYNSTKYWDLVLYRAGFSYKQTPLVIGTKPVDDMNVSFGMSLPVGRGLVNLINFSFVVGQRGSVSTQTFRERYGRVVVGFSLKDEWFRKFKVD